MKKNEERDAWLRERLQAAVDKFTGGSADKFGRLLGYTNGGYVREVLLGKKPLRAALIERCAEVPELAGWFDEAPPGTPNTKALELALSTLTGGRSPDAELSLSSSPSMVGSIAVALMAAEASMGLGASVPEHDEVVRHMEISETWLRRNASFTHPNNLALVTGYGDSMFPTFGDGDVLLVDRGVNDVRVDAVYVLGVNDELYIKRVQRRPDGSLLMISDNNNYPPYPITNGAREKFRCLGRVIMAWNSRRL